MDSCDSTGRSNSTVAYKKKDRRSLPEEFSDWTAFVHIVFEPSYFTPILHSM